MPLYRNQGAIVFFIHIPKTGGTTVERALSRAGASQALKVPSKRKWVKASPQHWHRELYQEVVHDDFYDYAFTVVRNPYSRFVSEYKMKVIDAGATDPFESWTEKNLERCREYPFSRDNHLRPQVDYLSDQVSVFRYEDGLEAPIQAACAKLGLKSREVPHAKRGSPGPVSVTRRSLERLREFYARDFEELGYSTEDIPSTMSVRG